MTPPWLKRLSRIVRRASHGRAGPTPPAAPPGSGLVRGELDSLVATRPLSTGLWTGGTEGERLLAADPWFHSHYVFAPHVIREALSPHVDLARSRILDIGCGDGIMALGVHQLGASEVVGTDLTRAFDTLPPKARDLLGLDPLPPTLQFRQGELHRPLPVGDGECDAVFSWSVFEHVDGVDWLLREARRALRPGGVFFLQIEPLYYSPFGSHLLRLIEEPWAHLSMPPEAYIERAQAARDHVSDAEKDLLYQLNEFEFVKRYLIGEYHSLNRITAAQLVRAVLAAGFEVVACEVGQVMHLPIPPALLEAHDRFDLVTNEIRLTLRNPEA